MSKILVVDDDALMSRMYQTKFASDGFEVTVAGDGEEGLKKASEFLPNLILLDIMMPKMDGLTMLKKLKEDEITKNIPIIMLTNVGGAQSDVDQALELGAVTYLVKTSYTPKEVVEKAKEILAGYTREIPKVQVSTKPLSKNEEAAKQEVEKAKAEVEEANKKLEEVQKKLNES